MSTFVVSQAERWHRRYEIEADSLEEAKEKYKAYLDSQDDPEDDIFIHDPEYLEDLEDDVEWYDKSGNILEVLDA